MRDSFLVSSQFQPTTTYYCPTFQPLLPIFKPLNLIKNEAKVLTAPTVFIIYISYTLNSPARLRLGVFAVENSPEVFYLGAGGGEPRLETVEIAPVVLLPVLRRTRHAVQLALADVVIEVTEEPVQAVDSAREIVAFFVVYFVAWRFVITTTATVFRTVWGVVIVNLFRIFAGTHRFKRK